MSELANDNLGSLGPVATQIREGLVFGRSNGDAFIPSNVRARALTAWRKASEAEAKRAEAEEREPNLLQPIGLHECRHTYASFCIAVGVNAKALTEYMGHSSITVSFDLYGHLMPGNEAEAAGLLDGYLDRATKLSAVFGKGERKHDRILHVRPGGGGDGWAYPAHPGRRP